MTVGVDVAVAVGVTVGVKSRSCRWWLRASRHRRSRRQDHKNLKLIGIGLIRCRGGFTTITRIIPLHVDKGCISINEHGWHAEIQGNVLLQPWCKHLVPRGIAKRAVVCPTEIRSPTERQSLLFGNPIPDRAVTIVLHLDQEQRAPVVNPTGSLGSIDRCHAEVFRESRGIPRRCRRGRRYRRRHRRRGRRDGHRLGFLTDGVVRHDDSQHIGSRDQGFHDLGAGWTRNGFPIQVDRFNSTHGPGQRRRLTGEDRGRIGHERDEERLRNRRGRYWRY